jgi:hypothetical protein
LILCALMYLTTSAPSINLSISMLFHILHVLSILTGPNTWVISNVLHTVCFLFKNEFILQNTITGLQCNLHCALSQRSNVWANLLILSGRLRCWCVWLLRSPH